MMKVTLVAHTDISALKLIASAGRTCRDADGAFAVWTKDEDPADVEKKQRMILSMCKHGHLSVFEHVSYSFTIDGVSRAFLAQYSRHRIGVSLTVQSQRSVEPKDIVVPESIKNNEQALKIWDNAVAVIHKAYRDLVDVGIRREDARFICPEASTTSMLTTVNLRSLLHAYWLRVKAPGAQWEIHEVVEKMVACVVEQEPWLKEVFDSYSE